MARCLLADGRCGRLDRQCPSGPCVARTVRRLHERRWRDKLGLFFVEGEDAVEAATVEPVELLVAGENVLPELLGEVSTAAHPPRVIGVYRRSDLPAADARPVTLELWYVADPGNLGTLIRSADACRRGVDLARAARARSRAARGPRGARRRTARRGRPAR